MWCLLVTDLTAQGLRLRHNAIVEATDDAVLSFDIEGRITSWNRGAEALFGHTAEEAVGRTGAFLGEPPEPELQSSALDPLERSLGAPSQWETRCLAKTGEIIDVAVTSSTIREPDGRVTGMCAIVRDIREQKRSEAELRESGERQAFRW